MFVLFPALALAAVLSPPHSVKIPTQPELTRQVEKRDAELFKLFFEGPCDLPRFRGMITDDVEFYHDKDGFDVRNSDDFVSAFAKVCHDRATPGAWRSRRELVRSTLHVDPVPGWGAIETGEHLFFERKGSRGQEKLVGRAKFAQLWVLGADGKWRLGRVLSYDHKPVN